MKRMVALLVTLGLMTLGVLAGSNASAEDSLVERAGKGIKKGAEAADRGIKKGGKAAVKGVKKGTAWVGHGIKKTGEKMEKADKP